MNAHTSLARRTGAESLRGWVQDGDNPRQQRLMPITLEDGSMVIPPEKLARFGGGDAARGRRELRALIDAEHDRTVRFGPAVRPKSIRIGKVEDEAAIHELLLRDAMENAARIAVVDPERIMEQIHYCTRQNLGIIGLIDGPAGKPIAVAVLAMQQWWWSREWFFQEVVNYVHSDHRHPKHIDDMLEFARWVVDKQSVGFGHRVYCLFGILGLHRFRAKVARYRRKNRQVGAAFLYPCPYGDEGGAQ